MSLDFPPNYLQRFGGVARLYGDAALAALSKAHMAIIGLGGVGTWAAEALVRSGVGEITLIELDDICVTNTNRQSHTLQSTVGQTKNRVISARLRDINPDLVLHSIEDFILKSNIAELIGKQHHVVIDATDATHIKAALIAYCSAVKVRLIVCGSSGGKRDPQLITVADLANTRSDPMLAKIRTQLFRHHNFARDTRRKFRVDAVYSTEQMVYPKPDGTVNMDKHVMQQGIRLDCAAGIGSSLMVTGCFGFMAAAKAIERYLEKTA